MSRSINSGGDDDDGDNRNTDRRRFTPIPIRRITFRDNDSIANMTPPVNNTTTSDNNNNNNNTAGRRRRTMMHTSNIPNTLQHEIVWHSEPSSSLESKDDDSQRKVPWMPLAMQEAKAVALWTILTLVLHGMVIRMVQVPQDSVPPATSFLHALSLSYILRSTRSLMARLTDGLVSFIIRLDQVHQVTPGLLFAPANLLRALQTWKNTAYGGGILPNLSLRLCEWRMGRLGQRKFWVILLVHALVPYLLSGLLRCLVWLPTFIFSSSSSEPSSSTLVSLVLSGMSSSSSSSSNSSNAGEGITERILASAASAPNAVASQATMENNLTLLLATSSNHTASLINNNTSQCAGAASATADCLSSMTSSTNPNLMAATAAASTASAMTSSEANVSWMLLATFVTRHVLVTTVFTTGLLVVPVLLKVNGLPEWLTFILLLPLYSIPVTRSGQGSTLNATATMWLLLTTTTTTTSSSSSSVFASTTAHGVSVGALLWQHLVPQLLGGWLAGRIMKGYFPDDPKA